MSGTFSACHHLDGVDEPLLSPPCTRPQRLGGGRADDGIRVSDEEDRPRPGSGDLGQAWVVGLHQCLIGERYVVAHPRSCRCRHLG